MTSLGESYCRKHPAKNNTDVRFGHELVLDVREARVSPDDQQQIAEPQLKFCLDQFGAIPPPKRMTKPFQGDLDINRRGNDVYRKMAKSK
ncbi:hypothetical protein [Bradyrhizobium sp. 187]|uniref:hypothetical protein n=1 Tax=Bradyrhizobium sp. 187 TaxID=2782655 RepID=UPI001FFF19E8|nr:hypothetical protein [Bradyrhizobium sp. 187]UPJ76775.1 hypothetical protein IVB19_38350 [Bradyrhizobium sp. 187]